MERLKTKQKSLFCNYILNSLMIFSRLLDVGEDANGSSEEEENCGIMMMGSTPQDEREVKKICKPIIHI